MLNKSFRIGRLFGFPIELNISFLIMLGVVFLFWGGLTGLFIIGVAFASVLLHELGHALVARHLGVPIAGIELHFFGGAAKMAGQPRSAGDEVAIAAAGPAVSFALGGVAVLLASVTGLYVFQLAAWINLVLGVFNLIPALPMDGGRIFRAVLSKKTGYVRATEISVTVARGFAVVLGLAAIATGHIYLALLAIVLWMMGTQELRVARILGERWGYGYNTPPRAYARAAAGAPGPVSAGGRPQAYRIDRDEPRAGPGVPVGRYVIRRGAGGRMVVEFVE